MSELFTQQRREDARREARRYLANRPGLAFAGDAVRRCINQDGFDFTAGEIGDALTFLVGLGQAEAMHNPLGATQYYRINSDGVLAHERGE